MIENVLAPWSTYEFRVQAANEYGYGTLSTPSPQFNTPGDKPYRAPSNIVGAGGKIGDLTIAWTVSNFFKFWKYCFKGLMGLLYAVWGLMGLMQLSEKTLCR